MASTETHESFNPVSCIAKKRAGESLSKREIDAMIEAYTDGRMADYQMSAWLMAAVLRGLSLQETVALTDAMRRSGQELALSSVKRVRIDKHSTGGVGDKVSICLAPWVAACGLSVPMIAGRGLGHTGGTLDKLEAIAGYRTRLEAGEFERVLRRVGASIIGQTEAIAPADRKMYALRDVTATVDFMPLIVASILSKKLACRADGLVLDVKCGRGAFMKSIADAKELACSLVQVGRLSGRRIVALVTRMDRPLGRTIGNALEVAEAIDVLKGQGPPDVTELTETLAVEMLLLGGVRKSKAEATKLLRQKLEDSSALDKLRRMIEAHGGDARVVDEPTRLPRCRLRVAVEAERAGYVNDVDSLLLAGAAGRLGAARLRMDQEIDTAVGIELAAFYNDRIEVGQPLAFLHVHRKEDAERVAPSVLQAFKLAQRRGTAQKLVLARITR